MMDDAVIIPIYYYKDYRLLQPKVRNFPQNSMEYRNLRDVYFVPAEGK
jgi:ABC-type oligopeptide transport system substrate-binding subunit